MTDPRVRVGGVARETRLPEARAAIRSRGSPSLLQRLLDTRAKALGLFGWWALSRLVVISSAVAATQLGSPRKPELRNPLRLLSYWDGAWYHLTAARGYLFFPGFQNNAAFFPGYPLLLRGLHAIAPMPFYVYSTLASSLMLLAAMFVFAALSKEVIGEESAYRAARWLAIFPISYVFSMAYPQALLLLLVTGFGLALVRNRFLLAAFLVASATLVRPEGALLVIPALGAALSRWRTLDARTRGLALGAVATGPMVLAAYPLYLQWALGRWDAWFDAERMWRRSFRLRGAAFAIRHLHGQIAAIPYVAIDAAALAVYLLLLVMALRTSIPRAWIVFGAAIVLLPLESGTVQSLARFGLIILPVYWVLALIGRNRRLDRSLTLLSLVLLAGATATLPYTFP